MESGKAGHRIRSFLLLGGLSDLGLLRSANLLHSVLAFLALLASDSLDIVESVASETMLGFELLGKVEGVVDEGETGGFAASEVCSESEDEAHVGCDFVHRGELVADVLLGDGGESGVENVANHLFTAEQTVRHELAGADCCSRHLKSERRGSVSLITKIHPRKAKQNSPNT